MNICAAQTKPIKGDIQGNLANHKELTTLEAKPPSLELVDNLDYKMIVEFAKPLARRSGHLWIIRANGHRGA